MTRLTDDRDTRPVFDESRAASLFLPMVAFLRNGGLSRAAVERSFAAAIKRSERLRPPRAMRRIRYSTVYADIVARWRRDGRFVTANGTPRDLTFQGRGGFVALTKSVDVTIAARTVLEVLCRFGTVKRMASGRYRLVRPYFSNTTASAIAIEPMAYFLADLTFTFDRILNRSKATKSPPVFWRKVESLSVSEKVAEQFVAFAGERSQTFLEEMDDWLEARAGRSHKGGRERRVGLGLFSIYSDFESPSRAS